MDAETLEAKFCSICGLYKERRIHNATRLSSTPIVLRANPNLPKPTATFVQRD